MKTNYIIFYRTGFTKYHKWYYFDSIDEAIEAAKSNPNAVELFSWDGEIVWELNRGRPMT